MTGKVTVELGPVQQTLFIPLDARARESAKRHPIIKDDKAAEIIASVDFDAATYSQGCGGVVTVLRTAIFDHWVSSFLAGNPGATVVEVGTGLNSRYERVDNGQVHWIDLDLPDTIELRRKFFAGTARRRVVAASALAEDWFPIVRESPGPYFFVADGVLAYLEQAPEVIARLASAFPGALLAFDTYDSQMTRRQHQVAEKKQVQARWAWACDNPRSLESLGLEVVEAAAVTRPPAALRTRLPRPYRYLLPAASRVLGDVAAVTLYRSRPTARYPGEPTSSAQ